MRWIRLLFLSAFALLIGAPAARAGTSFSLSGGGQLGTPTRPTQLAAFAPEIVGYHFSLLWHPHPRFAVGGGFERQRFNDEGDFRFWTGVYEALLRGSLAYGNREPYLQLSVGFNALSKKTGHWHGDRRYQMALGDRVGLFSNLDMDIRVTHSWWEPKPDQFQSLDARVGLVLKIGASRKDGEPKPTQTPTPEPSPAVEKTPEETPEPSPAQTAQPTATRVPLTLDLLETGDTPSPTPTPSPAPESGSEESVEAGSSYPPMRAVYERGIEAFRRKDWKEAERLLKEAAGIEDPQTPFWYYAEAHAMLAVVYLRYLPDRALARQHARKALDIDPATRTAQKVLQKLGEAQVDAW